MPNKLQGQPTGESSSSVQSVMTAVPKVPSHFLESAGFIAITSGVFYFMGYSYYAGFFERLSFPAPYPELSTSDYFIRAFTSVTGLFFLAGWIDNLANRFVQPRTLGEAFRVNAPFILVPTILLEFAYIGGYLNQRVAVPLILTFAVGVLGTAVRQSIAWAITSAGAGIGIGATVGAALILIYIFSIYFGAMGEADAVKFIEGRKSGTTTAVIETTDPESTINGTPLLLALDRGSRFYLVKQQIPAPIAPLVFVVPESEVLSLTIQRAGTTHATPVP